MKLNEMPLKSTDLETGIQAVIGQYSLFGPTERVLVAVSGGPDSTALLLALHRLGYCVHAAHVNHGLRPEAVDDEKFVAEFCRTRAIPLKSTTVDVIGRRAASGGGVQEVARDLRYSFLETTADSVGASVIATAHTQDDRIESVLLNIIRGTGGDGLRGIPYRRRRIVRPMLDTSRADIEAYLSEHGITPRRDQSNDTVKYARNRVRNELIPYIERHFNSTAREAILRLSRLAADESDYIDRQAVDWIAGSSRIDARAFGELHAAVQRRVLRRWIDGNAGLQDVGLDHIEFIRSRFAEPFALTLPGGARVVGDGGWIEHAPKTDRIHALLAPPAVAIDVPGTAVFDGRIVSATGNMSAGGSFIVRTLVPGDRMAFRYGRKKLSDIFQEMKIPKSDRWTIPLLVDGVSGEVMAIANGRTSDTAPDLTFTATQVGD